ncbi:sel1 repeat family protein [Undibacterium amnicola]|uniref:Sel1 repeat family protein n=1 Tax=Undibacterium amnicola TaxID=1834038 RepID=A0ABR6XUH2_9BURK|nr:tetratricopeptide repeat protein [Undibacterium amnicola]MBC3833141.1 sel1 repeat family protein [Undibacterium amnicola]
MHFIKYLLVFSTIIFSSPASAEDLTNEAMFSRLSALASGGNAEIKYNLGMFLNNGIGTARDNKAAFQYFSEAAESGHELASYKVGCYLAGQFPGTVPVNEADAHKFKLRAAEAGYDLAQFDVGLHFAKKRDFQNALIWWERASRQGNLAATAYLSNYFSHPSSPAPNLVKSHALALLLKAMMPEPTKELLAHIVQLETKFNVEEKSESEAIRASWLTGKTALSLKAQFGISSIPALLKTLEQ